MLKCHMFSLMFCMACATGETKCWVVLQIQYLYDDIKAILNEYRQINERINPYKQFGMYSWENEANSKRLFHMFIAGSGSEKRRNFYMLLHLNSMSDICQPQIYKIGISN